MDRIKTEHGIFTSNEIIGKTAQEVYENWLANKDVTINPDIKNIKTNEELQAENDKLKAQLDAEKKNGEFLEDCIVAMAGIIYA